jgi:hypothetical protein
MKLRFVSFRRFSLRALSVFLLGARPGNAQTLKTGPPADRLRPGNEINLDHGTDETSNDLTNDQPPPWFVVNTLGPRNIVAGLASAGLGTSTYKSRGDQSRGTGSVKTMPCASPERIAAIPWKLHGER